jgi:hypothetical protein
MLKLFYIFLFVICTIDLFGQNIQREGVVNMYSSMDPEGFRRYTWFEDSTIIFEIYEYYSETSNDSIISEGSRLAYYTILDLPTMHAQDYFLFSEDSEPITNYYLKDNETVSWGSFSTNQIYDKFIDSLIPSTDTVIDGNRIKRLLYKVPGMGCQFKATIGLSCSNPKTIFHFYRKIDEKYPDCQVTYYQFQDTSTGFGTYGKLCLVRDSLTSSERMIFNTWKSNLITTSLPITSQIMARQFISNLKGTLRYHR